jgi:hypothetical protein
MEHNIEKNIRLKVYQAEQHPVRWGKEELWTRMEINRSARSKRPVYFSIAASLTIAILAGVYTYQHIAAIPDKPVTAEKTESAQPAAANEEPSINKDIPVNVNQGVLNKAIAKNNARIRIEEEPYISAVPITSDTINIPQARIELESPADTRKNTNVDIVTEDAVKRPKVIIGIIPQQEQPLLTQQEKKKKFRFLQGKSSEGESEGSQLIIARIN